MLRRLLGRCLLSLSALSLLLCVAVGGLGVRSRWRSDLAGAQWSQGTGYVGERKDWQCLSERGKLYVVRNVRRYHRADTTGPPHDVWPGAEYFAVTSHGRPLIDPTDAAPLVPPSGAYFAGLGAGRYYKRNSSPNGTWGISDCRALVLPHWAAALLFLLAATPFLALIRRAWRRRRRLRRNLCLQCGYDLRASGSLCPECGTAVADAC
jgi:hypothetical protein